MKYTRGTNQFRKKTRFVDKAESTLVIGIVLIILIAFTGQLLRKEAIETAWASEGIISPLAAPTPEPKIPTLNPDMTEREQNIDLIKRIWGRDSKIGLELARCESGYRTSGPHVANTNRSVDQGVFSINSIHKMPEMENAVANISYAYIMYQQQGTAPWNSSKYCWAK